MIDIARQVVVEIVGDSKKFTKSLDDASKKSSGFSSVLKGIGAGIGFGALGLLTGAIGGVVEGITGAVEASSKLQQSSGAVVSVFGKAASKIEKFGETAASSIGLSKNQVNEMAAVMGAGLQGMGFSADEAADKTLELQQRAADMAATFGGTTSDAVSAITSLMRGERDAIEKYGVSLKQADIDARVLALGLDTSTAAAKKNAEATAAMDLLMEQTSKTSGQFAKESGSLAGKQQILSAKMENTAARIGGKLMPVFVAVATFVEKSVIPVVEDLITYIFKLWKEIEPLVKQIAKFLIPIFKTAASFIAGTLIPVIIKIASVTLPALINIVKTVATVFSNVFNTVKGAVTTAATTVMNTIKNVQTAFTNIVNFVKGVPGKIAGALSSMFSPLWQGFRSFVNRLISGWNSLKFTVPSVDLGPLGRFGGFSLGTPNIPYLHAGGIVPGAPGSDVPAILQAGERVIPRKDVGKGNIINITVQGSVYGDLDELARDLAFRLRTVGG